MGRLASTRKFDLVKELRAMRNSGVLFSSLRNKHESPKLTCSFFPNMVDSVLLSGLELEARQCDAPLPAACFCSQLPTQDRARPSLVGVLPVLESVLCGLSYRAAVWEAASLCKRKPSVCSIHKRKQ